MAFSYSKSSFESALDLCVILGILCSIVYALFTTFEVKTITNYCH